MSHKTKYPPATSKKEESDSDSTIDDDDDDDESDFDVTESLNAMTVHQRRKIYALKGLQQQYRETRKAFLAELAAEELALMNATSSLREERRKVISGEREVTAEELKAYQEVKKESGVEELSDSDDEEGDKGEDSDAKKQKKSVKVVSVSDEKAKDVLDAAADDDKGGIPSFWLTALQNSEVLEGMIQERDIPALHHITDITKTYIDGMPRLGFVLTFAFSENDFFSNEALTKTYHYDQDPEAADDESPMLERIEGCEISWKNAAKKLTVVIKQKKQRHKSGKGFRVVTREEKCPSFFNYFTAPKAPEDDEDDGEDDGELDFDTQMEMDYEAATLLSESLIPRAVHYYSGRSIEEIASAMDLNMLMGPGDEEDEDEEDEEEEEEEAPRRKGGKEGGKGGGFGAGRGFGGKM